MPRFPARFAALLAKGVLAAAMMAVLPFTAHAQVEQQTVVDRATLELQELFAKVHGRDPLNVIRRARAVMICPQVFRAGFIFGASAGACVLVNRANSNGAGSVWSYPAFYGINSGSVGFQIGLQDAEIVLFILTERGLHSILDSQVKLGADASVSFATLGRGIEAATTADLGADVLVVGESRGLYAGISIEGSVLTSRSGWNQAYYGTPFAARQIILDGQGRNQGADPLREMLGRYGEHGGGGSVAPVYGSQPSYNNDGGSGDTVQLAPPAPRGSVSAQPLPPVH
jgi:lipid-binding SYLF domain-containing protein